PMRPPRPPPVGRSRTEPGGGDARNPGPGLRGVHRPARRVRPPRAPPGRAPRAAAPPPPPRATGFTAAPALVLALALAQARTCHHRAHPLVITCHNLPALANNGTIR